MVHGSPNAYCESLTKLGVQFVPGRSDRSEEAGQLKEAFSGV